LNKKKLQKKLLLEIILAMETKQDIYDVCGICGLRSPYTFYHHIDYRIGYVEGGGQGCFQPQKCHEDLHNITSRLRKIEKIKTKITNKK
jgi:ppGpp synthetase/RelA/SpoT-type nucleotidyltranferase